MADIAQATHWLQIGATALVSSAMGGVIGGLVAWGGIRIRLDHVEQKVARIAATVVFKDVCEQCRKNGEDRQHGIEDDIKEIKQDIKALLNQRTGEK